MVCRGAPARVVAVAGDAESEFAAEEVKEFVFA